MLAARTPSGPARAASPLRSPVRAAPLALALAAALAGCSTALDGGTDLDGDVRASPSSSTPARPSDSSAAPSAAPSAAQDGGYAVLQTEDGTGAPVVYGTCRPIAYVTNLDGAPDGVEAVVRDAVAEVSRATGLRFVDEGTTAEEPGPDRDAEVAQYGDRWAPVLIAWATPEQVPELDGDTAGLSGSTAYSDGDGRTQYVSGDVLLDGPDLDDVLDEPDGEAQVRGVVLHELGHLVGLDHVEDPAQLMFPEARAEVTDYQDGDLAGLALMGSGSCVTDLSGPTSG